MSDDEDEEALDDDGNPVRSAAAKEVYHYLIEGMLAPPTLLAQLLRRRAARAQYRAFGLSALAHLLNGMEMPSALVDATLLLRPALRPHLHSSLTTDAPTKPWTLRHHYLNNLEGCAPPAIDTVQSGFLGVYTRLATLLNRAAAEGDPCLGSAIMWTWGCDLEARDHEFLLRTGIASTLARLTSMAGQPTVEPSADDAQPSPSPAAEAEAEAPAEDQHDAVVASKEDLTTIVVTSKPLGLLLAPNAVTQRWEVQSIQAVGKFPGVQIGAALKSVNGLGISKGLHTAIVQSALSTAMQGIDMGQPMTLVVSERSYMERVWSSAPATSVQAALASGSLSKRRLIEFMRAAPPGTVPPTWFNDHRLADGSAAECATRHSVFSMVQAYQRFAAHAEAVAKARAASQEQKKQSEKGGSRVDTKLSIAVDVTTLTDSDVPHTLKPPQSMGQVHSFSGGIKWTRQHWGTLSSKLSTFWSLKVPEDAHVPADTAAVSFVARRPLRVYVAVHDKAAVPPWLVDYERSDLTVSLDIIVHLYDGVATAILTISPPLLIANSSRRAPPCSSRCSRVPLWMHMTSTP